MKQHQIDSQKLFENEGWQDRKCGVLFIPHQRPPFIEENTTISDMVRFEAYNTNDGALEDGYNFVEDLSLDEKKRLLEAEILDLDPEEYDHDEEECLENGEYTIDHVELWLQNFGLAIKFLARDKYAVFVIPHRIEDAKKILKNLPAHQGAKTQTLVEDYIEMIENWGWEEK